MYNNKIFAKVFLKLKKAENKSFSDRAGFLQ